MTLGERIREQRKARGMSQEMVAGHLGVSRQAVAKWENGQSAPSAENLHRLAELLGTTAGSLLDSPAVGSGVSSSTRPPVPPGRVLQRWIRPQGAIFLNTTAS